MGRGIKLTDEQWDELDRVRFSTSSADVFRNCLIILKSDRRETIASIAEQLGCGTDTVVRVRRLYREGGVQALRPIKPPGRPGQATPAYRVQLRQTVMSNPLELGYGFSTWSAARLGMHLAKITGVRFGDDRVRELLKEEGFSLHRPKHTLKGKRDEQAYQKAGRKLATLKKNAVKEHAPEALVFADEAEVHRHPTLARMWAPVGEQPQVPAPGKNEKQVVYGAVDYATGRIVHTVAATKSGAHFILFLTTLLLAYAGRRICLVLDNGRFHHTQAVDAFLHAHRDQLRIFWLPPYCPSLNLIERLWGHLKRTCLANVLFETLDDLLAALHKGIDRLNGHRDQMGFMFNHDDVQKSRKKAA